MAYEKTRAILQAKGVTPEDIEEIISTYADDLAAAEPAAINAIDAASNLAVDFRETLSDA